ncbi:MAG TPA: transposase [Rhodanobacteraceae bacterium]|nr:transposase [Rhodanobacteraceae bacterium]
MPRYIRAHIPGGTFFFTIALLDRRQRLLIEHIDCLRDAFTRVRAQHPFTVDAAVILPDHLHCIWTLPPDDADFSMRWHAIKSAFSRSLPKGERLSATPPVPFAASNRRDPLRSSRPTPSLCVGWVPTRRFRVFFDGTQFRTGGICCASPALLHRCA